jgi:rRNA-processing protein EBP2
VKPDSETTRASGRLTSGVQLKPCQLPKGEIPFSTSLMARQKITIKKSVSQPSGEDKGDTNSKLVQLAPSHELDANEFDESHDDDDKDSGVDDEGLEKLMDALGEDGLNEFDLAQLRTLSGPVAGEEGSDDEEEGSDGEEGGEDSESAPQEEEPGEVEEVEEASEGIALDDDDVDSVDQDAIPRRKVQVDNKVRRFDLFTCQLILFYG